VATDHQVLDAVYRTSFLHFAKRAFFEVEPATGFEDNWHLEAISEHLDAVYRGDIKRLIINMPPRTLKSYLIARAFPAWVMGRSPNKKFIVSSYGHEVAEQNSLACRRIMKSPWYQQLFKGTRINPEVDRNTHFETTMAGQYYAASALSPVVGIGADIILLDDLIKPMEAGSETVRNSVNENMRSTFFSRLNDKRTGAIILVMQRVHEDDPAGHLLKDGGWVHLKLPAEAHEDITIELGDKKWEMKRGDLLFPARLSRTILDQTRLDMSEFHYVGQYLQEPVPLGGGELKEEWLQFYAPGGVKPKEMNICILVDPAGGEELNKKKRKNSDWTVFVVVGLASDNNYYVLDMVRDRLNPTDRIDTLFMLHRKWNELSGKPPKVGYEKYGMMTDTHYAREKMKQDAYNFQLIELGGSMMKEERIRRLIPDMQNGRLYVPGNLIYVDIEGRRFDLITELKGEMASFPKAKHDDILDALSRIYTADLHLSFPKQKVNMVRKAINAAGSGASDNWRDF
jgi:predicted phage terminase large subunit-like protein